ncbi:MAG: hypothetical protein GY788_28575 [bacterium]|nr:hypothetical protein [bacterium]
MFHCSNLLVDGIFNAAAVVVRSWRVYSLPTTALIKYLPRSSGPASARCTGAGVDTDSPPVPDIRIVRDSAFHARVIWRFETLEAIDAGIRYGGIYSLGAGDDLDELKR